VEGRDRGSDVLRLPRPDTFPEAGVVSSGAESTAVPGSCPPTPGRVVLTRTARGWSVSSPAGSEPARDLVEGFSLADLVAEEFGALIEPDRNARRAARGTAAAPEPLDAAEARVAELERTVAQLEHALAARVSTERAIGVLAERHGIDSRAAFELLRRDARSQGRPVAELARKVLDSLTASSAPACEAVPPLPRTFRAPRAGPAGASAIAAADGAS
jgi:hypothetical protein